MLVFNDQKDMAEKYTWLERGKCSVIPPQECDGEMRIQHREGDASVSPSTAPQSECSIHAAMVSAMQYFYLNVFDSLCNVQQRVCQHL